MLRKLIAKRVVLECEERTQHSYANPPVVFQAPDVETCIWIKWQQPRRLHPQSAAAMDAYQCPQHVIVAIDLAGVPPVAIGVRVGWSGSRVRWSCCGRDAAANGDRVASPVITARRGNLDELTG